MNVELLEKDVMRRIYANAINESCRHICKLKNNDCVLYCRGMWITLGMAVNRRRRNIKRYKQIMRGII